MKEEGDEASNNNSSYYSWKQSLPHVLVATISSFLFGYHLGVVNEPLESISVDLGFAGNTSEEGLVVSMCLGAAKGISVVCFAIGIKVPLSSELV
ncbi:uncharacterized protein A4U43_UnF1090 [Asparagus officinalis]|uniref:Major facilitator superfamily (MFS) profile domain-containing protein n=1 Tax=Asparagus officinalis TaxID=4686 RepID=A0A1R3L7M5_ASPOF|nr:uncharacterized protein A4U43_UnF1090 [Asparagus officinalis]